MDSRFTTAFACVLALSLACTAQCAVGSEIDALKRMEALILDFVDSGEFSGSVLVAKGGKVLFDRSYGYADIAQKKSITPQTRFQIGSTTKQFTAAAVMLLEERGALRLDDPVRKYFPQAPVAWDKITLFHLLTHTSGIPNYTELPDFLSSATTPTTSQETIARFQDKPLAFKPGDKWAYSNSGYILLGVVIERVSGATYGEFLAKHIFNPLGMKDTSYGLSGTCGPESAKGHSPANSGRPEAVEPIHLSIAYAAGGLCSTTRDLLHWQRGLHGGQLVSAASLKRMTTPYKDDYGFGLAIEQRYWHFLKMLIGMHGTQLIHHGGGTLGFSNHVAYYPEQEMTVAVLGNIQGNAPFILARRLATVAFNEPGWPLKAEHPPDAVSTN